MSGIFQKIPKYAATVFLLFTFLSALFVAFTHVGAPVEIAGQISTCPYAQLEGTCVSGPAHHLALSQHLINILPQILFGFLLALIPVYFHKTPKSSSLTLFNGGTVRSIKNISHILFILQELFARGILHPKKY